MNLIPTKSFGESLLALYIVQNDVIKILVVTGKEISCVKDDGDVAGYLGPALMGEMKDLISV